MYPKQPTRHSILDLIKAVAIVMVITTHLNWTDAQRIALGFPFYIDMAVPLFMMVSGFVSAQSFLKRYGEGYPDGVRYPRGYLSRTFVRYFIPYLVFYAFQMGICLLLGDFSQMGLIQLARHMVAVFLTGGLGPGSYYFPVLMQFLFWFPAIYALVQHSPRKGLLICFIINFAFEFLKIPFVIETQTYRLLIFRYTFVIACGCYFGLGNHLTKWERVLCFLVGAVDICAVSYLGLKPVIFNMWQTTSAMAALFVVPVFELLLKVEIRYFSRLVSLVGGATYNIYLIQMEYFTHTVWRLPETFSKPVKGLYAIVVCVGVGVVLTWLEKPLMRKAQAVAASCVASSSTN